MFYAIISLALGASWLLCVMLLITVLLDMNRVRIKQPKAMESSCRDSSISVEL